MFYYSEPSEEEQDNGQEENKILVFEDLNLSIEKGSFTVILGHNGCGKSTFAKHTNAILLPCGGKMTAAGFDTSDESRLFDIRKHIGMVFQNPDNQIVASVVEEDVAFALENMGVPPDEMRVRVDEALKAVGMYEYREHSPSQLSGGQKQRVAIAGIIAMKPDCIVLDEPTAMLDPAGRREVMKTIKRLNRENGVTIVLITHYMDEAAQADRVVVMDGGKVILDDTPSEVFSHVEKLREVGLDVPQSTQLMYLLRENGRKDADTHIITEEECADFLEGLLRGK
ncbi:energy-coupling factor transporter ATPase [Huintestinicola sp.]|uniref:energy-coupling factor transporter ATPase n=1 Tax=Huintestinicola sp. TaxID=2981661 RepID=UPI003D7D665C